MTTTTNATNATNAYEQAFARALNDPEGFWGEAAEDVRWHKRWDKVLDVSNPPFYRWFAGAQVNTCFNALDRHVEDGRGAQVALIYDSPLTGAPVKRFTFARIWGSARFPGQKVGLDHTVRDGDTIEVHIKK